VTDRPPTAPTETEPAGPGFDPDTTVSGPDEDVSVPDTTLVEAAAAIDALGLVGDEAVGGAIVRRALTAPLYWIAANAGLDGAVVVSKVADLPAGQGFNAATLEYGDLIGQGVVDPVKVTRSAVVNAASVGRMVLTTESAVVDKPAEDDEAGHGHAH